MTNLRNAMMAVAGGGVELIEVGNSGLFNSANNEYLTWTPSGAADDATQFVWSVWYYKAKSGVNHAIMNAADGATDQDTLDIRSTEKIRWYMHGTGHLLTTAVYRDIGWYHIVCAWDTDTGVSGTNKMRLFVNGVEVTAFDTDTNPGDDYASEAWAKADVHTIGRDEVNAASYCDGYVAECVYLDGQSLQDGDVAITDFGEFSDDGLYWTPKDDIKDLTFGTNGFYQTYGDNTLVGKDENTTGVDVKLDIGDSVAHWSGTTGSYSFGGGGGGNDIDATTNDDSIYTNHIFYGDFDFDIVQYDATNGMMGCFAADEVGTFSGAATDGALSSMTNSFYIHRATGGEANNAFIGAVDENVDLSHTDDANYRIERRSGTITLYKDDVLLHEFTSAYTGPVACFLGNGNTSFNANDTTITDKVGGNHFYNFNTVTQSTHTPTNLFSFWNAIDRHDNVTISNGNRTIAHSTADRPVFTGTLPPNTKGYIEVEATTFVSGDWIGVCNSDFVLGVDVAASSDCWVYKPSTGYKSNGDGDPGVAYGGALVAGEVIGIAWDLTLGDGSNKIWIRNDGTWENSGDPAAGTNTMYSTLPDQVRIVQCSRSSSAGAFTINPGVDAFDDAAPTGFMDGWSTTTLAEASTRNVSDPYEHWANCLYDGTGAALDITIANETPNGSSFDPEFVWTKNRDQTDEHKLVDIVRGATKELNSDSTNAESTDANGVTSITSTDKYVLGTGAGGYNDSGEAFVGWAAKLGGAAAPNTDGSLTSSISANNTLGMVVGTYSGDGSNYTVGHGGNGNSETPLMVIVKNLSTAGQEWRTYHKDLTANYSLNLDDTSAQANTSVITSVGSSTFTVGSGNSSGASGEDYVFIAWFASEFISIGSYEGNDIADGVFISCINSAGVPLQPIWTLHKKSSGAGKDWRILDAGRNEYNALDAQLAPNLSNAEGTADAADFVSGGIKLRSTSGDFNDSSSTYIRLTIGIPEIDRAGRILAAR